MICQSENEGLRVLDDFSCDAIPAPGIAAPSASKIIENEEIRVLDEFVDSALLIRDMESGGGNAKYTPSEGEKIAMAPGPH